MHDIHNGMLYISLSEWNIDINNAEQISTIQLWLIKTIVGCCLNKCKHTHTTVLYNF